MKSTDTLLICSDFYSVQGEGITTGVPSYFIRLGNCNLTSIGVKPGRRIPRIMTPHGSNIRIHSLKPGDEILAHDEETGTLTTTTVQAVYEYKLDEHYEITIEDTPLLYTSDEHLFLTNKGWKRVDELQVGDEILHYTSSDKKSFHMKHRNPMKNKETIDKKVKTMDYVASGLKVSETRNRLFSEGKLKPSFHILKEKDPERYEQIISATSERMKLNNPMFDPEVVQNSKGAHSLNHTKHNGYHSKTEEGFHKLCIEHGLGLEYTGNYSYPVKVNDGRERHIYPDFILPGTNKVYEIYWSGSENSGNFTKSSEYRENRNKLYKDAGYECVFVDYTLENKGSVIDIIKSEIAASNGKKVLSVKKITASKFPSTYKPLTCYDIMCYPHNTFIVEDLVTHNCGFSAQMRNKLFKEKTLHEDEVFVGDLEETGTAKWSCDSTAQWLFKGEEKQFSYVLDKWKELGIYDDICTGKIHIIWTGGEPCIKSHQAAIERFTRYWLEREMADDYDHYLAYFEPYYEIETNGTIYIEEQLFLDLDQINCSPKLSNSGMSEKKRIVPDAIKRIMEHNNYWFKFVVSNEDDIEEVFKDFITPFNIPLNRVICMPAMTEQTEFFDKTKWILEMAMKYKFRGLSRLHIAAWDKTINV